MFIYLFSSAGATRADERRERASTSRVVRHEKELARRQPQANAARATAAMRRAPGPPGGRSGGGSAAYDSYLEQENDMQISALAGKVSALKDISIQIGGHIKEDNRLLDDMGGGFDNASGLLGSTMKRLGNLSKSSGGWHMAYLAGFVLFVFLLLWRMTK